MNDNSIPKIIQPREFAQKSVQISGSVAVSSLRNFDDLLLDSSGAVAVTMDFGFDEAGFCVIKGEISTDLLLQCQRCLRPVLQKFSVQYALCPIASDAEAKSLPANYEPVMMTDGRIETLDLISSELMLAKPVFPAHADGECAPVLMTQPAKRVAEKDDGRHNPFKDLKKILAD